MNVAKRSHRGVWIATAACLTVACESTGARDGAGIQATSGQPEVAAVPREPVKPPEPGTVPSAPLVAGSEVQLPSIRAKVRDFARGEAAWRALRRASPFIPPSATGREYALVRVALTGVASESWIGCQLFRVIGADRLAYSHGGQVPPEPALPSAALKMGRTLDGWCTYSIRSDDHDLILMVDDPDSRNSNATRYLALERDATLPRIPAGANDPTAVSIGKSALVPAKPGSEVVTRNWTVKVVDVVGGADAQHLVQTANPQNPPPAEGLEFVGVQLHARYHGPPGRSGLLSPSEFRLIGRNGEPYDVPIILDVVPRLSRTLFPGGEHTGWAIFQTDPTYREAVLRFEPYFPDREVRYLALTHDGANEQSNAGKQLPIE